MSRGRKGENKKTRTLVASKGHDMKILMLSLVVGENDEGGKYEPSEHDIRRTAPTLSLFVVR